MSALMHRARSILSITSLGTVITLLASSPDLRATLTRLFHPSSHPARFAALVLAFLLNAKALPLAWHVRLFTSLFYQLRLQPTKLPRDALLRPLITKGVYTPLPECDYNGHKSNSTYFADFDIARTQLLTCLLRTGIRSRRTRESKGNEEYKDFAEGRFMIALGGVSCTFKREVKPYERCEVWTRVLSWDGKWIYMVSHMVREGAVAPDGWALQPGKKSRGGVQKALDAERRAEMQGAIFASSVAKYVVKKGRRTVPPEQVLNNSFLLPARPVEGAAEASGVLVEEVDDWTWERVEEERVRGLELAAHFGALDGLHQEFPLPESMAGNGVEVLGQFYDFPF